jgi:hypothetical protein
MPRGQLKTAVRYIHRLAGDAEGTDADAQLMEQFVQRVRKRRRGLNNTNLRSVSFGPRLLFRIRHH